MGYGFVYFIQLSEGRAQCWTFITTVMSIFLKGEKFLE